MLLNQPCAFIDIETTGTHANSEGITEIGLRLVDTTGEFITWQQLINPGRSIPGFIQQLTGISNSMVADQPYFEDIAAELYELLDSAIFVAHNARFDLSFIKKGLESCGYTFKPKVVCTVKLSRALYPQHRHHNLDIICERINYQRIESHRALADVDAMLAFIQHAVSEHGIDKVNRAAQAQMQRPSQPTYIDSAEIDKLPNRPGVYRFYDENQALLYVGKSVRIQERVKSHFSADLSNAKEMKLSQEVRTINHTETLGELGALLLENHEIKTLKPIYNRRQRRYLKLWCFELNKVPVISQVVNNNVLNKTCEALVPKLREKPLFNGVDAKKISPNGEQQAAAFNRKLYGLYSTKSAAEKWLRKTIDENGLCKKVLGLEKTAGSCFNYQIKRCSGACVGDSSINEHNRKLLDAFANNVILAWPFAGPAVITEEGETDELNQDYALKCQYHVIDQWAHLGTTDTIEEIGKIIAAPDNVTFDRETYRFLNRHIHLARPIEAFTDIFDEESVT